MRYLDSLKPVHDYLDTKAEIERLTAKLDKLKPLLTAALIEEPEQRFVTRGYEFTISRRTSYNYSDKVKEAAINLRAMKQAEVATGVAEHKRTSCFPVVKAVPTV
jgi:hypothetical protein